MALKIYYLQPSHGKLGGKVISVAGEDYNHACFRAGKAFPATDYCRFDVLYTAPIGVGALADLHAG